MILQAPVKMHFRLLAFITMSITLLIVNVAYNNTVNHNSSGGVLVIPKSSLQRSHPNNCCVKKSTSDNCTAPPAVSTCPSDRFFLFLPYGNFNNALRMLVLSLIIGQWTHRSVLLVDGMFRFNWRQSIEYSFDNLCVRFANESQLLRRLPIRKPPLRMLYWDDTAAASVPATLFGWWSVDRVHLDGQLFNRLSGDLDNIPRLACVASRLPEFNELDDDAVIAIPNPFFLGLSKSEYMRVFAGIRIHSTARTIGQQFIQSQFNNQQFVGIHLRWFEGVCEQFSRQTFAKHSHLAPYLNQSLDACQMTWSFVAQHMMANGFDPLHTPVFLASDNQRPNITRAFLMRSNVKSFVAIGRLQPPVDARLIDMYVLTKSALFIGHPLSSLSFHVALWRELDGWPTNTNILAGYKERGYLHHLFDNFD